MPSGPDMMLELACGQGPVCGVDEAGRGPWAGPVSAAAVILDPDRVPKGLNDSKKLSAKARAALEEEIKAVAIAWCVDMASIDEIAQYNILHATGRAMCRAIEGLSVTPAIALVDGNYRFPLPCPIKTVVKGDSLSCSIAAASILAKEARDRLMIEMDAVYPGYGFASHKGYHARIHVEGLVKLGPSPIHRLGWAPVKAALAGELNLQLPFEDAAE
ncbi:MAG: ribonuclease HII [Caulobacter sp.]|nr:ribonuclease HII [Caulobacter sp.]